MENKENCDFYLKYINMLQHRKSQKSVLWHIGVAKNKKVQFKPIVFTNNCYISTFYTDFIMEKSYSFECENLHYYFKPGDQIICQANHSSFKQGEVLTYIHREEGKAPLFRNEKDKTDYFHVKDLSVWKYKEPEIKLHEWTNEYDELIITQKQLEQSIRDVNLKLIEHQSRKPEFEKVSRGSHAIELMNNLKIDIPMINQVGMQNMGLMRDNSHAAVIAGAIILKFTKLIALIDQAKLYFNGTTLIERNYSIFVYDTAECWDYSFTEPSIHYKNLLIVPLLTEQEAIFVCDILNSKESPL